jgi:hypothetical protein
VIRKVCSQESLYVDWVLMAVVVQYLEFVGKDGMSRCFSGFPVSSVAVVVKYFPEREHLRPDRLDDAGCPSVHFGEAF